MVGGGGGGVFFVLKVLLQSSQAAQPGPGPGPGPGRRSDHLRCGHVQHKGKPGKLERPSAAATWNQRGLFGFVLSVV